MPWKNLDITILLKCETRLHICWDVFVSTSVVLQANFLPMDRGWKVAEVAVVEVVVEGAEAVLQRHDTNRTESWRKSLPIYIYIPVCKKIRIRAIGTTVPVDGELAMKIFFFSESHWTMTKYFVGNFAPPVKNHDKTLQNFIPFPSILEISIVLSFFCGSMLVTLG